MLSLKLMMHSAYPATPSPAHRDNLKLPHVRHPFLRRIRRRGIGVLYAGVVVMGLLGPVHAEDLLGPAETPSSTTDERPAQTPAAATPITVDPFIQLRGSVWRTKTGIVFLKTPIGLLTLTSKTTLKDLKASQEVYFWVHDRHSIVEIRKRTDGSLVHRYLSGPMTFGTDAPKTLRWWGPDGDQTVHLGMQEEHLVNYREGDPLTVEVDETNTISGVHDLQFDLQVSQAPPADNDVQFLLSGTVSKVKSNFVFVRSPVGLVMLNSKIGIPRVKVGQSLTVHIDHGHVNVTFPTETLTPRRGASPIPY
jgi:hypothetical protein